MPLNPVNSCNRRNPWPIGQFMKRDCLNRSYIPSHFNDPKPMHRQKMKRELKLKTNHLLHVVSLLFYLMSLCQPCPKCWHNGAESGDAALRTMCANDPIWLVRGASQTGFDDLGVVGLRIISLVFCERRSQLGQGQNDGFPGGLFSILNGSDEIA